TLAVTGEIERPHLVSSGACRRRQLCVAPGVLGEPVHDDEGWLAWGSFRRPAVRGRAPEVSYAFRRLRTLGARAWSRLLVSRHHRSCSQGWRSRSPPCPAAGLRPTPPRRPPSRGC